MNFQDINIHSDRLNIPSVLFTTNQTHLFLQLYGITTAYRLPFALAEHHPNSHYPALLLSISHRWNLFHAMPRPRRAAVVTAKRALIQELIR